MEDRMELEAINNEAPWMAELRAAAFETYRKEGMPAFKYGITIKLNTDLALEDIDPRKKQTGEVSVTSNVDELSELSVLDLHIAAVQQEEIVKPLFMNTCVPYAENKITAFHAAFWNRGYFIHVPKATEVAEPLRLSTVLSTNNDLEHILILAEPQSRLRIIDEVTSENTNKPNYRSKIVEVHAQEGAQVEYVSIQNLDEKMQNFSTQRTLVSKDARVDWIEACLGSSVTRSEVTSRLQGPGAESNIRGLFFGTKKQQFVLGSNAYHEAPYTKSDIVVKGVLNQNAKCIYIGKVRIEKNAPKSNGYQKEDTLLLSENAEADSIPQLEIDNNDVKCSHGATVGQVDQEKLFYLMSRGFSREEAEKQIVTGFFEPLIRKIGVPAIEENLRTTIDERLAL